MADGRYLENKKIVISQQPLDQFRQNLACWCIMPPLHPIGH